MSGKTDIKPYTQYSKILIAKDNGNDIVINGITFTVPLFMGSWTQAIRGTPGRKPQQRIDND